MLVEGSAQFYQRRYWRYPSPWVCRRRTGVQRSDGAIVLRLGCGIDVFLKLTCEIRGGGVIFDIECEGALFLRRSMNVNKNTTHDVLGSVLKRFVTFVFLSVLMKFKTPNKNLLSMRIFFLEIRAIHGIHLLYGGIKLLCMERLLPLAFHPHWMLDQARGTVPRSLGGRRIQGCGGQCWPS